jgi:hypothetical protein
LVGLEVKKFFFFFFFFFFLGPVCVGSGSTSAFKAYCAALNF